MANSEIVGLPSTYYGSIDNRMTGFAPVNMRQDSEVLGTLQRGFSTLDMSLRQLSSSIVSIAGGSRGIPSYQQAAFTAPNSFTYGPMYVPPAASAFPQLYSSPVGMLPLEWQSYARSMGVQNGVRAAGDIASYAALFAGPGGLAANLAWNFIGKPIMNAAYPIDQIATFNQAAAATRSISNTQMVTSTDILQGGSGKLAEAAEKYFEIASLGREQNYMSRRDYDTAVKSFIASGIVDFSMDDVKSLRETVNENLKVVRELADTLHTTISDSAKTLSDMKSNGLIGPMATQTAMMARATGLQTGMNPSALLSVGGQLAPVLTEAGLAPQSGYGMVNTLASSMGIAATADSGTASLITRLGGSEQTLNRMVNTLSNFISSPNAMYLLGFLQQDAARNTTLSPQAMSSNATFSAIAGQAGLVAAQTGIVTPYDAATKVAQAANNDPNALLMTMSSLLRAAVNELATLTGNRDTAITLAGRNFGMSANDARALLAISTPENIRVAQQVQTQALVAEAVNSSMTTQMGENRDWWEYASPTYWGPELMNLFLSPFRSAQQQMQAMADRSSAWLVEQGQRAWGYDRTDYGAMSPYINASFTDKMRLANLANTFGDTGAGLLNLPQETQQPVPVPLRAALELSRRVETGTLPSSVGMPSGDITTLVNDIVMSTSVDDIVADMMKDIGDAVLEAVAADIVQPTGTSLGTIKNYLTTGLGETANDTAYKLAAWNYLEKQNVPEELVPEYMSYLETKPYQSKGTSYVQGLAEAIQDTNLDYVYIPQTYDITAEVLEKAGVSPASIVQLDAAVGSASYFKVPLSEYIEAELANSDVIYGRLLSNLQLTEMGLAPATGEGTSYESPATQALATPRNLEDKTYNPLMAYLNKDMGKYGYLYNRLGVGQPAEGELEGLTDITETEAAVYALGKFVGPDVLTSAVGNSSYESSNPFYRGVRFISAFGTENDMIAEAAVYNALSRRRGVYPDQGYYIEEGEIGEFLQSMSSQELAALQASITASVDVGQGPDTYLQTMLGQTSEKSRVNDVGIATQTMDLINRVSTNMVLFDILEQDPTGLNFSVAAAGDVLANVTGEQWAGPEQMRDQYAQYKEQYDRQKLKVDTIKERLETYRERLKEATDLEIPDELAREIAEVQERITSINEGEVLQDLLDRAEALDLQTLESNLAVLREGVTNLPAVDTGEYDAANENLQELRLARVPLQEAVNDAMQTVGKYQTQFDEDVFDFNSQYLTQVTGREDIEEYVLPAVRKDMVERKMQADTAAAIYAGAYLELYGEPPQGRAPETTYTVEALGRLETFVDAEEEVHNKLTAEATKLQEAHSALINRYTNQYTKEIDTLEATAMGYTQNQPFEEYPIVLSGFEDEDMILNMYKPVLRKVLDIYDESAGLTPDERTMKLADGMVNWMDAQQYTPEERKVVQALWLGYDLYRQGDVTADLFSLSSEAVGFATGVIEPLLQALPLHTNIASIDMLPDVVQAKNVTDRANAAVEDHIVTLTDTQTAFTEATRIYNAEIELKRLYEEALAAETPYKALLEQQQDLLALEDVIDLLDTAELGLEAANINLDAQDVLIADAEETFRTAQEALNQKKITTEFTSYIDYFLAEENRKDYAAVVNAVQYLQKQNPDYDAIALRPALEEWRLEYAPEMAPETVDALGLFAIYDTTGDIATAYPELSLADAELMETMKGPLATITDLATSGTGPTYKKLTLEELITLRERSKGVAAQESSFLKEKDLRAATLQKGVTLLETRGATENAELLKMETGEIPAVVEGVTTGYEQLFTAVEGVNEYARLSEIEERGMLLLEPVIGDRSGEYGASVDLYLSMKEQGILPHNELLQTVMPFFEARDQVVGVNEYSDRMAALAAAVDYKPGDTDSPVAYLMAAEAWRQALAQAGDDPEKARNIFISSGVFGDEKVAGAVADLMAGEGSLTMLDTMGEYYTSATKDLTYLPYIAGKTEQEKVILNRVKDTAAFYSGEVRRIVEDLPAAGQVAALSLATAYSEFARYSQTSGLLVEGYSLLENAYGQTTGTTTDRLAQTAGLLMKVGQPVLDIGKTGDLADKGRFALYAFNKLYTEAPEGEDAYEYARSELEKIYAVAGPEATAALLSSLPSKDDMESGEGNMFEALKISEYAIVARQVETATDNFQKFENDAAYERVRELVRVKYGDSAVKDLTSYGNALKNLNMFIKDKEIPNERLQDYSAAIFNPLLNMAARSKDSNLLNMARAGQLVFEVASEIGAGGSVADAAEKLRTAEELAFLDEDTREAIIAGIEQRNPREAVAYLATTVGVNMAVAGLEGADYFSLAAQYTTPEAFATMADIRNSRLYGSDITTPLTDLLESLGGAEDRALALSTNMDTLVTSIESLNTTMSGDDSRINQLLDKLEELTVAIETYGLGKGNGE